MAEKWGGDSVPVPISGHSDYAFWSNVTPSLGLGVDMRIPDLDYPALRLLVDQWRKMAPNFYGDYYPLTRWSRDDSSWIAWQFDRPEVGQGMVQAFRRENSVYESARFQLRGLDPGARYKVSNLNQPGGVTEFSGRELGEYRY